MRNFLSLIFLYKKHFWPLALGVLFALLTALASISLLSLSGWFLSAAAFAGVFSLAGFNYMLPAAGVRFFSITRTFGRWVERVVGHDATFKLLASLRVFFFQKLVPITPNSQLNLRDADVLNRITADVDAMDHLYLRLISPLKVALFGIIAVSLFIGWFDKALAMVLGGVLTSLVILLPCLFYQLGKPYGILLSETKSALRISALDWLQGLAEFEIYGASERFLQRIYLKEQGFFHAQQQMAKLTAFANALFILLSGVSLTLMLFLAADGVGGNAPDPLIALVAFATLASFELIAPIAGAFQFLSHSAHASKRLNDILLAKPEVSFVKAAKPLRIAGALRFAGVSFAYPDSSLPVLNEVNLSVAAGEKVAILGATGSGKSTLLQLLTRAYNPSSGGIYLDDCALDSLSEPQLRQAVSLVTQKIDLFNGSLRHNLLLANQRASDAELVEVLQKVGLGDLLDGQGLDGWLGEGGRALSGGERRRIGIARALLHDAPLLLLDEPTEGLDPKTEQQILALLMAHCQQKTVLYITHRLVGLNWMDKVYRIDNGSLV